MINNPTSENNTLPLPRVLIVGTGAIGGFYGGKLAQIGARVAALCRSDYEIVKAKGIRVKSVYGDFNSRYFKSIIIANPDIEDPDRVNVGQTISLPAIPVSVTPPKNPLWWVRVDDRDSLEAAFDILRGLPDNSPGMRMIPYWNPLNGFRFALVLDELFEDELGARRRLLRLPGELADRSTILTRWDQQAVYFANPYFN